MAKEVVTKFFRNTEPQNKKIPCRLCRQRKLNLWNESLPKKIFQECLNCQVVIFTDRIRRMGRVLFSQACVCQKGWYLSVRFSPSSLVPGPFPGGQSPSPSWHVPLYPGQGYPLGRTGVPPQPYPPSWGAVPTETKQQSEYLLHGEQSMPLAVVREDFLVWSNSYVYFTVSSVLY